MSAVPQRPPLPVRVYAYVAAVAAVAIALLPFSRLAGGTIGGAPAAIAALTLAVLVALANRRPVHIGPRRKVNVATAPEVAAVLLLPGPLAVLALVAGTVAGEAGLPARPVQRVFNASVAALRANAGTGVYVALLHLAPSTIREPLAAAGAAAALYAGGTLLVIGIAAVQLRANPLKHAWAAQRDVLVTEAALSLTGMLAALAAAQQPWALVLLVAPAWLARRALQEAEARYRHIFEHALDGIFQTGPDGRFQAVNPAAARLLGYASPQELIAGAATARQLYADPAQYDAHQRLLSATGEVSGLEVEVRTHEGAPRWIMLNARAERTSDRRILRIEGIMTDITARKQAEQAQGQLLEHEQAARVAAETASRAKEEFFSLLSHDLRTPLTTIKASTQLLRRQTRRPEVPMAEVAEGLARIEAGAIRMDRMVGELLDLARLEMGELPDLRLRRTDLTPLLARIVDEYQQLTDEHEILLTPSAPELRGLWDGDRLERVFANLLSNAIKFSPGGGSITVTAEADEDADGTAWAVVSVCDDGVGIPSADLPRILTRFYRATNVVGQIAGNGIGLSGAAQIVEQHGGILAIDSTEGTGTTVSVRLPLHHRPRQRDRTGRN